MSSSLPVQPGMFEIKKSTTFLDLAIECPEIINWDLVIEQCSLDSTIIARFGHLLDWKLLLASQPVPFQLMADFEQYNAMAVQEHLDILINHNSIFSEHLDWFPDLIPWDSPKLYYCTSIDFDSVLGRFKFKLDWSLVSRRVYSVKSFIDFQDWIDFTRVDYTLMPEPLIDRLESKVDWTQVSELELSEDFMLRNREVLDWSRLRQVLDLRSCSESFQLIMSDRIEPGGPGDTSPILARFLGCEPHEVFDKSRQQEYK